MTPDDIGALLEERANCFEADTFDMPVKWHPLHPDAQPTDAELINKLQGSNHTYPHRVGIGVWIANKPPTCTTVVLVDQFGCSQGDIMEYLAHVRDVPVETITAIEHRMLECPEDYLPEPSVDWDKQPGQRAPTYGPRRKRGKGDRYHRT